MGLKWRGRTTQFDLAFGSAFPPLAYQASFAATHGLFPQTAGIAQLRCRASGQLVQSAHVTCFVSEADAKPSVGTAHFLRGSIVAAICLVVMENFLIHFESFLIFNFRQGIYYYVCVSW